MRVLSYNVKSLRVSARRVAEVIAAERPDVVCVQEAPRFLFWRRRCARLAERAGLVVVTGGRPAGAMLLLARPGVTASVRRDVRLSKHRRLHQRGLALAVFELPDARVGVASFHLGLDAAERLVHVDELLAHVGALGVPVVLGGDVNEGPTGPAWQRLAARYRDAFAAAGEGPPETFSARRPYQQIDAIFTSEPLVVSRCRVVRTAAAATASDHLPLVADVGNVAFP